MDGDEHNHASTKPTVNDIARVAGVSLATVDRVLNGRAGVRKVTIDKVNRAVTQLGYVRDTAAANLARRRLYRLLFILPNKTSNEFITALKTEYEAQRAKLQHDRISMALETFPMFDPKALVDLLDAADPETTDGIAIFGPETPSVRDAVRRAKERGLAIVALVADLQNSQRDHFVGIDNVAAGRTAGDLMGRFIQKPGKVLVVTGSRLARDHLERRSGFDAVVNERYPHLDVIASLEGRDDPDLVQSLLPDVFETHPEIRGIYSSAGGTPGLVRYLEQIGRDQELVVIAHDLTPSSRTALERGAIDALISQDTGHLIRSTVRLLKAVMDQTPVNDTQERIRIDIYLRENVPPDITDNREITT